MKIGLICPYSLDQPGGVQEHVKALYKQFKKKGHEVRIITSGEGMLKGEKVGDIISIGRAAPIFHSISNDSSGNINFFIDTQDKIKKVLNQENFDILHFHSPMLPLLSWQILAESKAVNIATFHEAIDEKDTVKTFRLLLKTFSPFAKSVGRALDGTIAVSPEAAKVVEKMYKMHVDAIIPNGIDLERFSPSVTKLDKFKEGFPRILFVGRLDPRKGASYLLKAYRNLHKKYPQAHLIIVGPGENEEFLRDLSSIDNPQNVHLEGFVPDNLLPRYYASADIYCSPATHGESFGIVLLEAMASGVPIVAFDNPGYREVLTGFGRQSLVANRNARALEEKLESLIVDPVLRGKLRQWGLGEAERYSWERIATDLLELYEHFLQREKVSTKKVLIELLEEIMNQGISKWNKLMLFSDALRGTLTKDR